MEWKQRRPRKDSGVNKTSVRFIAVVFLKTGPLKQKRSGVVKDAVSDARCLLVADKDDATEPEEGREPDSLSSVKSTVH